ncbi:MAG: hypothetical protein DRJ42_09735 [Deltaproteobacteria bacterium]|nr:MAG: hypothetical protein DRJ42_09735 [Deltaproteobacteria bacterium]
MLTFAACADSHDAMPVCDSPEPPCGPGFVEWTDERCWLIDGSTDGNCDSFGDGLCYRRCRTDADCGDPCRPHCEELAFYRGGPTYCGPPGEVLLVCKDVPIGSCDL